MDVRVGPQRRLSTKDVMHLNYGAGEDNLESPLDNKEIKPVNLKRNQSWIFIARTDAETEAPILWPPDAKSWLIRKDPDSEKDGRQEENGNRGWDGWMASLTQWAWTWANSGRWWRTGKPGVLQSMGLQKVGHNLVTEQQTVMTIMDGDAVSSAKIGKKQIENWALRWLIHHNIFPHCLLCFWIF